MNPKILVFGMHRSGTTLLADLLGKHPAVQHMFNESVLLQQSRIELQNAKTLPDHELIQSRGELRVASNVRRVDYKPSFDLASSAWGAKMSYPGPVILQEWNNSAAAYARAWLEYFDEEARILLVVRHPFDVFLSAYRRWANHPRHCQNYGPVTLDAICRDWCYSLDTILPVMANDSRAHTLRFETLVQNPHDTLLRILAAAGLQSTQTQVRSILQSDVVFFGEVRSNRAFQYRGGADKIERSDLSRSTRLLLKPHLSQFRYDST